jgi:hypothetical protein
MFFIEATWQVAPTKDSGGDGDVIPYRLETPLTGHIKNIIIVRVEQRD